MLGMEIAPDSSAYCLGAREAKVACNQICVFLCLLVERLPCSSRVWVNRSRPLTRLRLNLSAFDSSTGVG